MWEEHEDCKEVIKQGWGGDVTGLDNWETLISKVKNCKETLQLWHKRTFKNANIEIRRLKQNAQARLDQASSEIDWAEVKNLQGRIDGLWKQEEIYWGQRSRIKNGYNGGIVILNFSMLLQYNGGTEIEF